jgi:eukaryotic-like serine/threonine-protein kinase
MSAITSMLTIGGEIGNGHYGRVYSASDPIKGNVAVKMLVQAHGESDAEFSIRRKTLLSEGKHLENARHANIVEVYHAENHGDNYCLIMEKCDSSLLDDYKKGPMSLSRLRGVATQACAGLQHIHATGRLHRDIKPSNIMVRGKQIKIGDFGLASDEIIAGYASAQGYQDHLPPEFHINNATNIKSDIWAMGMTIWRLLHGKDFYDEHFTNKKPRNLVKKGKFATKLPWLPHIPETWRRLIRKAMHDDPNKRYQTVVELSHGLSKLTINPDWQCQFSPDLVQWRLVKGNSVRTVEFRKVGKRYVWLCEKSPKGKHIVRKQKNPAPKSKVWRELELFFPSAC